MTLMFPLLAASIMPLLPKADVAVSLPATNQIVIACNASAGAAGYWLYQGTAPGKYDKRIPFTIASTTVSNLSGEIQYYFAATATNTAGIESGFGNEVPWPTLPLTNSVTDGHMQEAPTPLGPWSDIPNSTFILKTNVAGDKFYRAVIHKTPF